MYKKCVVRRFHFTKWEYRRPWKYVTDRSGCWTFLSINDLAGPAGKLSNFLSDKQGGVTHQKQVVFKYKPLLQKNNPGYHNNSRRRRTVTRLRGKYRETTKTRADTAGINCVLISARRARALALYYNIYNYHHEYYTTALGGDLDSLFIFLFSTELPYTRISTNSFFSRRRRRIRAREKRDSGRVYIIKLSRLRFYIKIKLLSRILHNEPEGLSALMCV